MYPVYIVGAGPGDPELLTLKAQRLLKEADAVVHDRLIAPEILAMVPARAEKIFAGKSCKEHFMKQDEINKTLLALAKKNKKVVRLKGGDPTIFGRGGEEAEFLAKHKVPFEIVPGISSATGCAAYNGIPLTYRDLSTGVRYITGHRKEEDLDLNWASLADPDTTLVVYMGLANIGLICAKLIEYGLPKEFPVAVIQDGTTEKNKILITDLSRAEPETRAAEFASPTLIIIGKVVTMHGLLGK